jgi:RNA polymerase sigma-70 factor (ECF subfamily)
MATHEDQDALELEHLLRLAAKGDQRCWGELLMRYSQRLRAMIALRLDQRLQGRIDPSDILQEAFVEASSRFPGYARQPTMPFYLWLRLITGQKLAELFRHHLGTRARDAGREVPLFGGRVPQTSSAALATQLLGREPRPSEAAIQAEGAQRLQEALDSLEPLDREVLALRHFEMLSNGEVAQVLGIQVSAASKRYVRALRKLREVLTDVPGEGGPR